MGYPDNLLHSGERVVLHKHPHWKVLFLPVLIGLIVTVGGGFLAAQVSRWDSQPHTPWYIAIAVAGILLLLFFVLVPIIKWRTEHFVISTSHVFYRKGILSRREHQIPLARIQNLETVVTFWGRILGYGTLLVDSAADQELEFLNVANLSKVQSTLNQLIADDRRQHDDDGEGASLRARGYQATRQETRHRQDEEPTEYFGR